NRSVEVMLHETHNASISVGIGGERIDDGDAIRRAGRLESVCRIQYIRRSWFGGAKSRAEFNGPAIILKRELEISLGKVLESFLKILLCRVGRLRVAGNERHDENRNG